MKTVNEIAKEYGDYIVKDGFMDFLEKPKPKTVWDLEVGDKYFYIDSVGGFPNMTWNNDEYDVLRRNQGNVFLTLEEAQFEEMRRNVYATIKQYAYEFSEEEWKKGNIKKYYPCYDYPNHCIIIFADNCLCGSKLYFKSEEDIEKAIEAVGEEYFKKYYLGVKE